MDPILSTLGRVALALLFAGAARHKLRDMARFEAVLGDYQVLPRFAVAIAARAIVAVELILVLALLVPATSEIAALCIAGLLALYSGGIALNLARGRREIDCGCGGPAEQRLGPGILARNTLLIGIALASALPSIPRSLTWIDGLTLIFGVATIALLWQANARLMALALPPLLFRRRTNP